ncbi:hypothetical protein [Halothiobacillus sp. DCM-1]|uniref:hypothetical protein n=1 Tax=Halothiobacillus sp. DCM-1 TaxID=3112558 RepID=UPI00324DBE2E
MTLRTVWIPALFAATLGLSHASWAADPSTAQQQAQTAQQNWNALSKAEQAQKKANALNQAQEKKSAWQALSPEEQQAKREAARSKMQARFGNRSGQRH